MGEQLLRCSANFTAGFNQLLKEGNFVDCRLSAEGRILKAHQAVLSAASAYFKLLLSEEPEWNPLIIFTNIRFNDLETVLRFIYQGEVMVSEDKLAEFLNILTFLQINGLDCNKLVVGKTDVLACDNDNSFITFETTSTPEASSVFEKVEGEDFLEELADNNHISPQYLPLEESSPTKLASDYASEPACGYEFAGLVSDIEIKDQDEEINSNVKIEKYDMTIKIEDEPSLEDANNDNEREVSPGQLDASIQLEDVQGKSAVMNIGMGELFKCLSCGFETSQKTDLNVHMCHIVERPFQLSDCPLSSMQYHCAKNHAFKNMIEKPVKYSQCTYTGRRKNDLKSHKSKHKGEKPFKCSQCTYACSFKSTLVSHMHTG